MLKVFPLFLGVATFLFGDLVLPNTISNMVYAESKLQIEEGSVIAENGSVEFFYAKPKGEGPFPVIFLLHGFQPRENSSGGKQLVDNEYLDNFVREGVVAVAISVPGFGKSAGPRDFSGPLSQSGVKAVIDHFKGLSFVDATRIGIYGISRGATLASMISVNNNDLLFQILEAGVYDLSARDKIVAQYMHVTVESNFIEAGGNEEAYNARSAVFFADKIKIPTLILHGEFDDRKGLPSAKTLHEKLKSNAIDCRLNVYQNTPHVIFLDKWDDIIPYIREKFFNLYGLGIKVTTSNPAIQIRKIFTSSSAYKENKLKVGDAILKISPNNDDTEVDVLAMHLNQFISLVLGEKGSKVRLYVQHFDLSYEDIVLERG